MQIVNIARQSAALQLFGRSTGSGPAAAHFTGTLCLKNIASVVPMNGWTIRAFGADDVARLRLVFRKLRFQMIADKYIRAYWKQHKLPNVCQRNSGN
jgi:hypothetical protein